ncbi:MAG: CRISPR-associated protein Csm5 [Gammaproteobacteria bacterium]|nr:CRISPR-associated protein Csm5 [Gammaproteobacteria bacterium]
MSLLQQQWSLQFTPLSPIHLGTGSDYEPGGYVIEEETLFAFNGMAALRVLSQRDRDELNQILSGRANGDMLRQVQSFFHHHRQPLMSVASHRVRLNASMQAFYAERVGRVVQQERTGGRVQNKLEIERTAWNPVTQMAYLPGSGIKGAIRTALLDTINKGQQLPYDLKRDRQANQKLQEDLFKGKFHTDPLRLVAVGDAHLQANTPFATEVRFALNRKKVAITDAGGTLRQSKAEQQGLYQLLETLPALMPRAFGGTLSLNTHGSMRVSEQKWPSHEYTLREIASACNRFYLGHFQRECNLLKRRNYLDEQWHHQVTGLLEGELKQRMERGEVFLLRVGRHSGAESVTLAGVRNIKIMKGRGDKPDYLPEAKTVWLAGTERQAQRNLLPFGWLLVEVAATEKQLSPWPDSLQNAEITSWITQWRQREQELQQQRQKLEAQRRQEEEKQRQLQQQIAAEQAVAAATEAAASKAEAERQAALAAMSDEERQLQALKERFEAAHQAKTLNAGGQVVVDRQALLEAAQQWSPELQQKAAEVIRQTLKQQPWSSRKKKENQDLLQQLER